MAETAEAPDQHRSAKQPQRPPSGGRGPQLSGPSLLPKKQTVSRQVFLEPSRWEELKIAAKFHSDVFKALGSTDGVSRNALIDFFLGWALDEYWADKGGKPNTKKEWEERVQKYAERVAKANSAK